MITDKTDLIIPYPELRGSLAGIKYPAFVEIKKDGEFCYVHINENGSFTVNKHGTIRSDFPALNHTKEIVLKKNATATFLAELCINGGKNGALYELLANKKSDSIELHIFDVLQLDNQDLRNSDLITRKEFLTYILPGTQEKGSGICFRNAVRMAYNEKDVDGWFRKAIDAGYEGVVVKSLTGKLVLDSCDWVKVKYKDRTDYKVNLVDNTQERIEILAPLPGQKTIHLNGFVKVGVKASNKYKKHIKVGDMVTIEHQSVLASGSLRHPVLIPKPEWK